MVPDPGRYNIIVWGAQECPSNSEALSQIDQMSKYLGGDYVLLKKINNWPMFLVAFLHKSDFIGVEIRSIKKNYETYGVMNSLFNKGVQLLQFTLYNKKFSFVNVHLPSGASKSKSRAAMMGDSLKVMSLSKIEDRIEPDASCDFNYILGDLNARFKSTYSQQIDNVANAS